MSIFKYIRPLVRSNDEAHPERSEPERVPARYTRLIEWAKQRYGRVSLHRTRWLDGIFQLRGLGKTLWRGEDPDEYVRNLRQW